MSSRKMYMTRVSTCRYLSRSAPGAMLVMAVPACSTAFVDYATSGLENALTYLLVTVFAVVYVSLEVRLEVTVLVVRECSGLRAFVVWPRTTHTP
jgi:hypothetical protein